MPIEQKDCAVSVRYCCREDSVVPPHALLGEIQWKSSELTKRGCSDSAGIRRFNLGVTVGRGTRR